MVRFLAVSILVIAIFTGCGKTNAVKIGHSGGYLSAAVFAAQDNIDADIQFFRSTADIGYSLLIGALDAGFMDTDRLAAFSQLDGFERLTVVGKITYPYGSTVVLRKGLSNRLNELSGLTIAASAPNCKLLEAFIADAERLGVNLSDIKLQYIAFDAMLPALEAGVIDAAIIRGSSSVFALHEGHTILYQNWDVEPGDECCPAIIDQAVLVLLAQRNKLEFVQPFVDALVNAQKLSPDELRRAVANNTVIPFDVLQGQPVPEFSLADDELTEIFIEASEEHHGDEHDD